MRHRVGTRRADRCANVRPRHHLGLEAWRADRRATEAGGIPRFRLRLQWRAAARAAGRLGDFKRCPAEPGGLHEVYFEYDDENEYIARAHDNDREISRWAGTHEVTFPVITSALIDDAGVVKGIRMVTDARPEHRNDITEANRKKREEAYTLGTVMASRFDVESSRDCRSIPAAEGEGTVGGLFVRRVCERNDAANGRRIVVGANLYRKPGQSAFNPQLPTQLTEGQFESSARLEIFRLDP